MQQTLFTIGAGRSFLTALAAGLLKKTEQAPHLLADYLILLPNRRACRALGDEFFKLSPSNVQILPKIRPLGEIEEDPIFFENAGLDPFIGLGLEKLTIPPQINFFERQIILTQLIQKKDPMIGLERALMLADDLAKWLDEVDSEECDLDKLESLVPDELAVHWQKTLVFLEILRSFWPRILESLGAIGPANRRRLLVDQQIKVWQENPPNYPIIAAGSTGTVPATARMLEAISKLPKGQVILPFLDMDMTKEDFALTLTEQGHPQHSLAVLLEKLNIKREDVQEWPLQAPEIQAPEAQALTDARVQFMRHAMLPAATEINQKALEISSNALDGLTLISAKNIQEEAEIVACLLRETLETPNKTAALVTPNHELARRTIAELAKWGIAIDDAAGKLASHTPLGIFLNLILVAISSQYRPIALLGLLKHPFCALGRDRKAFLDIVRLMEERILRGELPPPSLAGIRTLLMEYTPHYGQKELLPNDRADIIQLLSDLEQAFKPLDDLYQQPKLKHNLDKFVIAHLKVAEKLATRMDKAGAHMLWQKEAGIAIAKIFQEILSTKSELPSLHAFEYEGTLRSLMAKAIVRPNYGRHPTLAILSPLEARLIHHDRLILGGLNQGIWPADSGGDPFMSRPMRLEFGLPSLERKIGLSAQDFYNLACQKEVFITFANRVGSAPAVPSRWLERMEVSAKKAGLPWQTNSPYIDFARAFNHPPPFKPVPRPAPTPPLSARPRKLSVTQIKTLKDDPYSIYARNILRLYPKNELEEEPDHSKKGEIIHKILEIYYQERETQPSMPFNGNRLREIGEAQFATIKQLFPEIYNFWWQRFINLTNQLQRFEAESISQFGEIQRHHNEVNGEMNFELAYDNFKLTAKADRLDLLKDGKLHILDYKSGSSPSMRSIKNGKEPQMLLEGLIAQHGGFRIKQLLKDQEISVEGLSILEAGGKEEAKLLSMTISDNPETLALIKEKLIGLINHYDHEDAAYLAYPPATDRYEEDYTHLKRCDEWNIATDDETEAEGD